MDHRSYIKLARRLTVQDRNIENNDHSNMYQRLKIEHCREVLAKLKLRALLCDPPNPGPPTVLEVNGSCLEHTRKDVSS